MCSNSNFFTDKKNKKGEILNTISDIGSLIRNYINDNDYVMIKGSNSTGLNNFSKKLKKGYLDHALDEFRHADLFKKHSRQIANKIHFQYDRSSAVLELGEKIRYLNFIGEKPIYSELTELEFINFVMISEQEAEKYFTSLSELNDFDNETRKLFKKIALEEAKLICEEDIKFCENIGLNGLKIIEEI